MTPLLGLESFSEPTTRWFSASFESPMQVQMAAWEAIRRGQNTLVVAPTGSGKTLAAFMWAIDQIAAQKAAQKALATLSPASKCSTFRH